RHPDHALEGLPDTPGKGGGGVTEDEGPGETRAGVPARAGYPSGSGPRRGPGRVGADRVAPRPGGGTRAGRLHPVTLLLILLSSSRQRTGMHLFELVHALSEAGEPFALATVVRCERPTSAKPGAKAVIRPDGSLEGWVGGGCAQTLVVEEAKAALRD